MIKCKVRDLSISDHFKEFEDGYEQILSGYSKEKRCYIYDCPSTMFGGYIEPDQEVFLVNTKQNYQLNLF